MPGEARMKPLKILNLYAGIGGNRKLWPNNEIEVTAIENNREIAMIYQDFFQNDIVIVADAHKYLLDHYKEFDFIWSSRPCQSHSKARYWASKGGKYAPVYPDMGLYEEIIFLDNFFKGNYVVENVDSYYPPLMNPVKISGHYIWSNFRIKKFRTSRTDIKNVKGNQIYGFDLTGLKLNNRKDQIIRNTVNPKLGLHIFKCAFKEKQMVLQ